VLTSLGLLSVAGAAVYGRLHTCGTETGGAHATRNVSSDGVGGIYQWDNPHEPGHEPVFGVPSVRVSVGTVYLVSRACVGGPARPPLRRAEAKTQERRISQIDSTRCWWLGIACDGCPGSRAALLPLSQPLCVASACGDAAKPPWPPWEEPAQLEKLFYLVRGHVLNCSCHITVPL